MPLLISGFEPFGGALTNPSQQLALYFDGIILPVVRQKCFDILRESIHLIQPSAILMIGQATGCEHIRLERIAINLDDYRIPDNCGNQPIEERIITDAPDAYFGTLPWERIHNELDLHQIPVQYSFTAGTYICNHLFFQVMHFLKQTRVNIPAGFIHVPTTMRMDILQKAIGIVILEINKIR